MPQHGRGRVCKVCKANLRSCCCNHFVTVPSMRCKHCVSTMQDPGLSSRQTLYGHCSTMWQLIFPGGRNSAYAAAGMTIDTALGS